MTQRALRHGRSERPGSGRISLAELRRAVANDNPTPARTRGRVLLAATLAALVAVAFVLAMLS